MGYFILLIMVLGIIIISCEKPQEFIFSDIKATNTSNLIVQSNMAFDIAVIKDNIRVYHDKQIWCFITNTGEDTVKLEYKSKNYLLLKDATLSLPLTL